MFEEPGEFARRFANAYVDWETGAVARGAFRCHKEADLSLTNWDGLPITEPSFADFRDFYSRKRTMGVCLVREELVSDLDSENGEKIRIRPSPEDKATERYHETYSPRHCSMPCPTKPAAQTLATRVNIESRVVLPALKVAPGELTASDSTDPESSV